MEEAGVRAVTDGWECVVCETAEPAFHLSGTHLVQSTAQTSAIWLESQTGSFFKDFKEVLYPGV